MDVTKDTFEAQLEQVRGALQRADFVAFDGEFTGLPLLAGEAQARGDSAGERYQRLAKAMPEYALTQLGLATFEWDGAGQRYICRPFNFYLFPRLGTAKIERRHAFLPSSLEFLAQNGFDFNKWVYEGITYMNRDEEENFVKKTSASSGGGGAVAGGGSETPQQEKKLIVLDAATQQFANEIFEKVDHWLQHSSHEPLDLPAANSFLRRVTHEQIGQRYNQFLTTESADTPGDKRGSFIRVSKLTEEERAARQQQKSEQLASELRAQVGFRRVMDALVDAQKPLVGHNCVLDLIQLYSKFHRTPPKMLRDFKTELLKLYPLVVDTKYLVNFVPELQTQFTSTALADAKAQVEKEPFFSPPLEFAEGFERYRPGEASKYHEAGYDAHCTGVVLVRVVYYLAKLKGLVHEGRPVSALLGEEAIRAHVNRIAVVAAQFPCINLTGEEGEPDRSNVVHVYDFPVALSTADIRERFGKKALGSVFLKWNHDTSVLVTLFDQEKARVAVEAFKDSPDMKVESHASYVSSGRAATFAVAKTPDAARQHGAASASTTPATPATPSSSSTEGGQHAGGDPVTPVLKKMRTE